MIFRVFRNFLPAILALFGIILPVSGQNRGIDTTAYLPYNYDYAIDYNLMIAASLGYDYEIIRMIEKGAHFDYMTSEGTTALTFAVINNHPTTTRILLEVGSDPNIETNLHETPLLISLFNDNLEIAEILIRYGADIDYQDDHGATALHYTALLGLTGIADLLLYYEADIEIKAIDGTTPLMTAIWAGNNAVAELLIKNGANMEARDNEGFTPFLIAAQNGNNELLTYLKDQGVDIYERNFYKWNALSLSILTSQKESVEKLLSFGNKWNSPPVSSTNPFKIATESGNNELKELLEKSGLEGSYSNSINQISVSLSTRFTKHGYYNGVSFTFQESVTHMGFSLGFDFKPLPNRVLFMVEDNLFYQINDNSMALMGGIIKEFPITNRIGKNNLSLSTSLLGGFYMPGNIEEPEIEIGNKFFITPSLELNYTSGQFGVFAGMEYMKSEFHGIGSIWARLGLKINLFIDNSQIHIKDIQWN